MQGKNKKINPAIRFILLALFALLFIYNSWGSISPHDSSSGQQQVTPALPSEYIPPVLPSPVFSSEQLLQVHFLDVGQADSIIIQTPGGRTLLIDGGNKEDGDFIKTYLRELGVKEIAAVIATHPHEDHIGGLQAVMEAIPVRSFYLPEAGHTTKTFTDLLKAVKQSGAAKIPVRAGKTISTDETDLSLNFLAPNSSKYEELNNYSAVLKVTYKEISFLLTGDAQELSEKEMLKSNRNLKATVLKVGHHGSRTSSSLDFLKAVNPAYAIISCGKDNEYGYPHSESIENLKDIDASILRTDILGTLLLKTDGEKLGIALEKSF